VNTEYAKSWPNITQKKDSPADAKDFEGMEGKFEKYFRRPQVPWTDQKRCSLRSALGCLCLFETFRLNP